MTPTSMTSLVQAITGRWTAGCGHDGSTAGTVRAPERVVGQRAGTTGENADAGRSTVAGPRWSTAEAGGMILILPNPAAGIAG